MAFFLEFHVLRRQPPSLSLGPSGRFAFPAMHRLIQHNAAEVRRLHAKVHATCAHRGESAAARELWQQAAAEFHRRYDALSFPGGLSEGLQRLCAGEPTAIEAALSFLEVHPYFFRSQYIATKLRRLLKHVVLSGTSAERLQRILSAVRQRPNHALQRTEAGGGAFSDHHA